MVPDNTLIHPGGYCLRDTNKLAICYIEQGEPSEQGKQPDVVQLNLDKINAPLKLIAIDTQAAYAEIEVASETSIVEWQPPYASDWAFRISTAS